MKKEVRLRFDDDVRDILRRSKIEGDVLSLPEQLDRPTYVRVDKVLKALGGKWDRKAGWHTFPEGTGERILQTIADGSVVDQKKTLQQFDTPVVLAKAMVHRANIVQGMTVLEPSAGIGRIANEAWLVGGKLTMVEIDEARAKICANNVYGDMIVDDFLAWAKKRTDLRFDRVIMNPPFADYQDLDHLAAAWSMLKDGGIMVALTAPGWQFHQTKKAAAFRTWVEGVGAKVEPLDAGTFRESGTDVRAVMLVIEKRDRRLAPIPFTPEEVEDPPAPTVVDEGAPCQPVTPRHVVALPLDVIDPDPEQPRKTFAEAELRELADSIRQNGLAQPIRVRPNGGRYLIVYGERRWRAHRLNGANMIDAEIDGSKDLIATKVTQIIENDQRQDVAPLEQAKSYQALMDQTGWDVPTLARRLGKAPHRIEERLQLLKLDVAYQALLACGQLKPSEAYEIARHEKAGQQALFQMVQSGQCKTYADLRVASVAIQEAAAQTSFDLSASVPRPPTRQQLTDAGIFEMHVARISVLLREGVKDNEIEAVKLVNPNKAAHFADLFQAMQVDMRRIEVALRQVAAQEQLKLAKKGAA